jgi:hypothetical protein
MSRRLARIRFPSSLSRHMRHIFPRIVPPCRELRCSPAGGAGCIAGVRLCRQPSGFTGILRSRADQRTGMR